MHAQRPVTHRGNRDRTATDPSHSWVKFRRNGSMMKRKRFLKAGTKIQRVLPMCVGDRILPRLGYEINIDIYRIYIYIYLELWFYTKLSICIYEYIYIYICMYTYIYLYLLLFTELFTYLHIYL